MRICSPPLEEMEEHIMMPQLATHRPGKLKLRPLPALQAATEMSTLGRWHITSLQINGYRQASSLIAFIKGLAHFMANIRVGVLFGDLGSQSH